MRRVVFVILATIAGSLALAQDAPKPLRFGVTLESSMGLKKDGQRVGDTETRYQVDYTLGAGPERCELRLVRVAQRLIRNQKTLVDIELNKDGGRDGPNQMHRDDAPPPLQAILDAAFREPISVIHFDADRRESKRDDVAKPAAQELIRQGLVHVVLFFHAPFPKDGDTWTAERAFSLGGGDMATGTLTYTRGKAGADGLIAVKVEGTLSGTQTEEESGLSVSNSYEVKGTQYYDPKLQHYVRGEIENSLTMETKQGELIMVRGKGISIAKLVRFVH